MKKELIEKALFKILNKYKDYSVKETETNLERTIKYLKEQKEIYRYKAQESKEKFNKFSIENGLGDIYGMLIKQKDNKFTQQISPGTDVSAEINLGTGPNLPSKTTEAGLRYKQQFTLLENYESEYINYSSKLKPNSKYLSNLKLKIENLKESLKDPTKY